MRRAQRPGGGGGGGCASCSSAAAATPEARRRLLLRTAAVAAAAGALLVAASGWLSTLPPSQQQQPVPRPLPAGCRLALTPQPEAPGDHPAATAVLISGLARGFSRADAELFQTNVVRPLLAERRVVDLALCVEAGAEAALAPLLASFEGVRLALACGFDIDPVDEVPAWPQLARAEGCRRRLAVAAPGGVAGGSSLYTHFVVTRPDLLVLSPLPPLGTLDREAAAAHADELFRASGGDGRLHNGGAAAAAAVIHSRVRLAAGIAFPRTSASLRADSAVSLDFFSFNFHTSECWQDDAPPVESGSPLLLADDAFAVVPGAFEDAFFAAARRFLLPRAGGSPPLNSSCFAHPTLRNPFFAGWGEATFTRALACAGAAFRPLALAARLKRHLSYSRCDDIPPEHEAASGRRRFAWGASDRPLLCPTNKVCG